MLALQTYLAQYTPPSSVLCKISTLSYYLLKQSLHWSEFLVAANRFVAVIFPHKYKQVTSTRVVISSIIGCWLLSWICELIPLLEMGAVMDSKNAWKMCLQHGKGNPLGFILLLAINTYIPISAEGALYLTIFVIFYCKALTHRRKAAVDPENVPDVQVTPAEVGKTEYRLRVAKMLFCGYILTATCSVMTPIIAAVYPGYLVSPVLFLVLRAVLLGGYSLHPVCN